MPAICVFPLRDKGPHSWPQSRMAARVEPPCRLRLFCLGTVTAQPSLRGAGFVTKQSPTTVRIARMLHPTATPLRSVSRHDNQGA